MNGNSEKNQNASNPQMQEEDRSRNNIKNIAKDAGSVALSKQGVPEPISNMAVNKIAEKPIVDSALNKASDTIGKVPGATSAINGVAESPMYDKAKSLMGAGQGSKGGPTSSPTSASKINNMNPSSKQQVPESLKRNANRGQNPSQNQSLSYGGSSFDANQQMETQEGLEGTEQYQQQTAEPEQPKQPEKSKKQEAKEALDKYKKMKKVAVIGASALPPILIFFIVILLVICIMVPLGKLYQNLDVVVTWFEKAGNWLTFKGFYTEEEAFYSELEKQYVRYENLKADGRAIGELDIALLAATVHYTKIENPENYSKEIQDGSLQGFDEGANTIQDKEVRAFYIWAEDRLGSYTSSFPGERRLLGHLVSYRTTYKCVALGDLSLGEVLSAWKNYISNDFKASYDNLVNTLKDTYLNVGFLQPGVLAIPSLLNNIKTIAAYDQQNDNSFNFAFQNVLYESKEFFQDSSPFSSGETYTDETTATDFFTQMSSCSGSWAIPVLTYVIDKQNYHDYLEELYVPMTMINCETCDNKDLPDKDKKALAVKITNEIFDLSEDFYSLFGKPAEEEILITSEGVPIVTAGKAGEIPSDILDQLYSPFGTQSCSQTSCFGYYSSTNCTGHNGVDMVSNGSSTLLYSIADGEVTAINRDNEQCSPSFQGGSRAVCKSKTGGTCTGNLIEIKNTITVDGEAITLYSRYVHLASIEKIKVGDKVTKGQVLGVMGTTGCSTGIHLHFSLFNGDKKLYNPESLFENSGCSMKGNECAVARQTCS